MSELKAPFPWFGGKRRIAHIVWERLGADVSSYCEPFAGSLAVLLGRPGWHSAVTWTETANDKDGFIANAWRAILHDPEATAHYADWPINEADLHARHAWLVARRDELLAKLEGDPDYYDPKIAGWWLWGIACWIGGGWCSGACRGLAKPWRLWRSEQCQGAGQPNPRADLVLARLLLAHRATRPWRGGGSMSQAFYVEPFVGWRGWRVYGGLLRSMHYPATWQPGERMAAACTRYDRVHELDDVPSSLCTCGIYAVEEHATLRLNYLISPPIVVGRVNLWGRVVRHARSSPRPGDGRRTAHTPPSIPTRMPSPPPGSGARTAAPGESGSAGHECGAI